MPARDSHTDSDVWTVWAASSGEQQTAESEGAPGGTVVENPVLTEDPLTGLPRTETLLPLIMNWAASRPVQAVCFHFVGLGILANIKAFESQSILRDAAGRITPVMGDEDRLTLLSGNKLLLFSTRPDIEAGNLTEAILQELASLGTEIDGQRVPQVRVGAATLSPAETAPVTMKALHACIATAEKAALHVGQSRAAQNGQRDDGANLKEAETPDLSGQQSTTDEEAEPIMITRGHPERVAIRHAEEAPSPPPPRAEPASAHRLVLDGVEVRVTGLAATAMVSLHHEDRAARGKAIGRSSEQQHTELVAEALTRAVTDLLPTGHGTVFRQAVSASTDFGDALVTVVEFLTPDSDEFLFGIAPVDGEPLEAVAKSILSALNHHTAQLLDGETP